MTKLVIIHTTPATIVPLKAQAAERLPGVKVTVLESDPPARLIAGDRKGHDIFLAAGLQSLAHRIEVEALAQASMARGMEALPEGERERCLASTRLAMDRVAQALDPARG